MGKMRTIRIEARSDDKFGVEVKAGDRMMVVDQAKSAGGADAGANPLEYLLSSLAGCIATTARIIASQKKLDLKGMDMKIEGAFDADALLGRRTDARPGVTGIRVGITLDSAMSEMERKNFFQELRSRAPVADTIAEATPITIGAG
jgi:uncharacterized OsmC-like protein